MTPIYHLVPPEMVGGTELVPLSTLREFAPELYKRRLRYYQGRERVMRIRIPILGNCLWNDVLFCTPVEPSRLRRALPPGHFTRPLRFYEIDAEILEERNAAFLLEGMSPRSERYAPFSIEELVRYREVPLHTRENYAKRIAARQQIFMFLGTTQILYRGSIDTKGLRIIEV